MLIFPSETIENAEEDDSPPVLQDDIESDVPQKSKSEFCCSNEFQISIVSLWYKSMQSW